jgi:hypothetical protein
MKKDECEEAIRALCGKWSQIKGYNGLSNDTIHPSYSEFKDWCQKSGYGRYFKFRAYPSTDYVAEIWFDQEFKQRWRN